MNILYIAEKPSLAEAIAVAYTDKPLRKQGYFDCENGVKITWCYGHMLTLKSPRDYGIKKWSIDDLPYEMIKTPVYLADSDKKDQIKIIEELSKEADTIVNAGDPDDEGQRIVDSLLEFLKVKNKRVLRIWLNDNNTDVVKKEIANLKENHLFQGLSQRALARAVADQIIGMNCTVALSVKHNSKLNAGRVSTPILAMVVNRIRERESHKENYYYNISSDFVFDDRKVIAKLHNPSLPEAYLDEKKRIINEDFANEIVKNLQNVEAKVIEFKKENIEQQPPLPYNLLKLQSDSANLFGFSAMKTQKITQELREKYKLITYNRTDCQYLNDEHHAEAPDVLRAVLSNLNDNIILNFQQKSRAFNSKKVTAHHAIIPTRAKCKLEDLPKDCQKIYDLICKRYIMQFMNYRAIERKTLKLQAEEYIFNASYSLELNNGWKLYLDKKLDDEEKEVEINIPDFVDGETGLLKETSVSKAKTQPARLYTVSSLLNELTRASKYIKDPDLKKILIDRDSENEGESGGIGTPATRASILDNLFNNGFLEEDKKSIIATKKGFDFIDIAPEVLKLPDLTALLEIELQKVENNELSLVEFIDIVDQKVRSLIKEITDNDIVLNEFSDFECKECQSKLIKRSGQYGDYFSCSGFPKCKTTYKVGEDEKPVYEVVKKDLNLTEFECKKCQSKLVKRNGQYGDYFSCSGYPKCKTTYKVGEDEKPVYEVVKKDLNFTEFKCKKCKSKLIKRSGQYGEFFACSGFPKCKTNYKIGEDEKPIYFP